MTARSCGDCGMCCRLLGAPSLGKPPRRRCLHWSRARGCAIYEDRPPECSGFNCTWLLSASLDEAWRPDRAGFLMHSENGGARLIVEVDPARPQAWRKPPFEAALRGWAAEGLEVLILVADRAWRLTDQGEQPVSVRRA